MLDYELIPAPEKSSRRLFIMMHGLGDSVEGYRWFPEALGLPWMNYLLVNAPDEYFGGFSWFDFSGDPAPGVARSRKMLIELLDVQGERGFPTEQTVLGGFSQGCLMCIDVGLRYPRLFAGIVGISGWVFEPGKLLSELSPVARQQRVLVTHGTKDPLLPFAEVHEQYKLLKAAGLRLDFREFLKGHTIAGEEELSAIRDFVRAGYSQT